LATLLVALGKLARRIPWGQGAGHGEGPRKKSMAIITSAKSDCYSYVIFLDFAILFLLSGSTKIYMYLLAKVKNLFFRILWESEYEF